MKSILQIAGYLGLAALLGMLVISQGQRSEIRPSRGKIKDIQVLLRPNITYRISFSEKLLCNKEPLVLREGVVVHQWFGSRVEILEQSPTFIRFRTLTLEEALRKAEQQNKQNSDHPIDLDFVRFEYEQGIPFSLHYMAISRDWMDTVIDFMFGIERDRLRRRAERVVAKGKGVEITPSEVKKGKTGVRFFLMPEGKDKTIYILPTDRCPPPK